MILLLMAIVALNTVSDLFALDLSLLPGVSPKNLLLYAAFGLIVLQIVMRRSFQMQMPRVFAAFAVLIIYSLMTITVNVLILNGDEFPLLRASSL